MMQECRCRNKPSGFSRRSRIASVGRTHLGQLQRPLLAPPPCPSLHSHPGQLQRRASLLAGRHDLLLRTALALLPHPLGGTGRLLLLLPLTTDGLLRAHARFRQACGAGGSPPTAS